MSNWEAFRLIGIFNKFIWRVVNWNTLNYRKVLVNNIYVCVNVLAATRALSNFCRQQGLYCKEGSAHFCTLCIVSLLFTCMHTGVLVCMCKQAQAHSVLVCMSVWLALNLVDPPPHGNRPIFPVRCLVTALKEKMEIPSSSSLASKWCMSPPINHRAALTDSWLPNIHLH